MLRLVLAFIQSVPGGPFLAHAHSCLASLAWPLYRFSCLVLSLFSIEYGVRSFPKEGPQKDLRFRLVSSALRFSLVSSSSSASCPCLPHWLHATRYGKQAYLQRFFVLASCASRALYSAILLLSNQLFLPARPKQLHRSGGQCEINASSTD